MKNIILNKKIQLIISLIFLGLVFTTCTREDEEASSDAKSIVLISGDDQFADAGATLENPIEVKVEDQFGHAFAETVVHFTVSEGAVSSPTAKTDARGITSVLWTLGGSSGSQSLAIKAFKTDGTTPLDGSPFTVIANAEGNAVSESLALVSGGSQTGQIETVLTNPVIVIVKDTNGNPFAGATVNFATSDGSVSASSGVSDANGNVSINWTLGATVGTQTLTVTGFKADGTTPLSGSPLTVTATGTSVPPIADVLQLVSGDSQSATINTALANPIIVRVLDQFENPFAGVTVNFATSDGSVSASSGVSDANGNVSVNWTLGATEGAQTLTVTGFKADGTTPLSGSPLTITATGTSVLPTADVLELVSGNNQTGTVDEPLANPIVIRVLDQFGNPFTGATVSILITVHELPFTRISDADGLVSINWTLSGLQNTQTMTVESFEADGITPLSGSPIAIIATGVAAIAADILINTSGDNQTGTVNEALANPIVVRVLDQFENPFAGATVNFATTDGSVSVSSGVSDANGNVSINWTLGATEGTQTLTVTGFKADGTTPLSGSPLTVTATGTSVLTVADTLELVSGDNQTGTFNEPLANPIVVRVLDQFENPFAGALVTFLGDGKEIPSTQTSDANGLVTINWILESITGPQTMKIESFKADGTTPLSGSPLTVTATGTAGADILINTSGDNQTGTVNEALANPIVVRVLDQFENPFVGATVNFATSDGSLSASSGVSDASGNVSVNWTLGATVGTQTMTVTGFKADGTTPLSGSPLTIFADAQAEVNATNLQEVSGGSQEGFINTTLAEPIVVRALNVFGGLAAGVTVFFTPTNGSVSVASAVTDSNGEAQTTWTLGPTVTDQLLTVTAFKTDGTTPLSGSPISIFVSAQAPLAIGDFHEGGVIFYLDNTGEHGLVSAITDQSSNAAWGCTGTAITGADGTAIGTGAQNTQDIIAGCVESLIAAEWCSSLNLNGFSDWFLPSQNELSELFTNKAAIDATAILFGGTALQTNFYWSSTEINANQAWGYNVFGDDFKNNTYNVRAVRAF